MTQGMQQRGFPASNTAAPTLILATPKDGQRCIWSNGCAAAVQRQRHRRFAGHLFQALKSIAGVMPGAYMPCAVPRKPPADQSRSAR
jgi:hypothetical protein